MASQKSGARRPRLSVAIIARDEQDVLAGTLESVRAIADEVVVLDTGSTDQTASLARRLGAKVSTARWEDDFSAARNRLLEEVTGDWVLWLDAGEQVTAATTTDLRGFINTQADLQHVYLLVLELAPLEPNGSAEQAVRVRLVPAHAGLRFTGRVGETLQPSIERLGLQLDAAPGRIVRHERCHREEIKAAKAQRDLGLVELERIALGTLTPALLNIVGDAYTNLHDPVSARQAFLQAIQASPPGSTDMLNAYYGLLTTFEDQTDQGDVQLTTCLEALELFPLDAQLLVAMGGYLQKQNRLDLAARSFDLAIKHGQINVETWHLVEIYEIAAVCLSIVLQLQREHDEACRVLETAIQRNPGSQRVRRQLADLYVRGGKTEAALATADAMAGSSPERESLRDAVCGACEAARGNWTAALGYLQAAYTAGCQDPLCLRWLTITLLSNAQVEAAIPVLQQWLEREPNSPEAQAYLRSVSSIPPEMATTSDHGQRRQLRLDRPERAGATPFQTSVVDCLSPNNVAPEWLG